MNFICYEIKKLIRFVKKNRNNFLLFILVSILLFPLFIYIQKNLLFALTISPMYGFLAVALYQIVKMEYEDYKRNRGEFK